MQRQRLLTGQATQHGQPRHRLVAGPLLIPAGPSISAMIPDPTSPPDQAGKTGGRPGR
jgi:hypothetical protein